MEKTETLPPTSPPEHGQEDGTEAMLGLRAGRDLFYVRFIGLMERLLVEDI